MFLAGAHGEGGEDGGGMQREPFLGLPNAGLVKLGRSFYIVRRRNTR